MSVKESLFQYLDLRGVPCPLNYIRCSLALENLGSEEYLKIDIDKGEPEETILSGLSKAGHKIKIISQQKDSLTLTIYRFDS